MEIYRNGALPQTKLPELQQTTNHFLMSTTYNLQPRHKIIQTLRYSKLLKPTQEHKSKSDDTKFASPPFKSDHPPSLTAWKSAEQNLQKKKTIARIEGMM
jgi:hypothetical protein